MPSFATNASALVISLPLWVILAVASSATAAPPDPSTASSAEPAQPARPTNARALAPGGAALVRQGLTRLAPRLAIRVLDEDGPRLALRTTLATRLAASPIQGLLAAYKKDADGRPLPTFIDHMGLTQPGQDLVRWLARARFHALDLTTPPGLGHLASGSPRASPAEAPAPPIDLVEAAWDAGRGTPDRLTATVRELARRLPESSPAATPNPIEAIAAAEVALAESFARLLVGLAARPRTTPVHADAEGRYLSPDALWRNLVDSGLPPAETAALLTAGLAAASDGSKLDAHLMSLLPGHPQYLRLVDAAERYANRCAAGGFTPITLPANDKLTRDPDFVKTLQLRLSEEGFFTTTASGEWDASTEAAILEYRRVRHLKEKGLVDRDLIAALSVPCEERLSTLVLNVRRWRHSAFKGERERVEVNLSAQIVRYFRDEELIKKERTVVGSDKSFFSKFEQRRVWRNATPILRNEISVVVVNPDWNVPNRIAREEIEPEIAKDPTYLEKRGFRVIETGGGNIYVQEPGPGNALGRIKILFPNSESVYLHDTPGKAAFRLPVRALSHGCVRVDNALDFGAELIRSDRQKRGETFDPERVRQLTQVTRKTWAFQIEAPIPVFLEYYTASVDEDGRLWFHPDIYGYDAETRALEAANSAAPGAGTTNDAATP